MNYMDAYYNRGCAFFNLKIYDKAIIDYTKVIELNPNNKDAYYWRGLSNMNINNIVNCCSDIKKAQQLGCTFIDADVLNSCK